VLKQAKARHSVDNHEGFSTNPPRKSAAPRRGMAKIAHFRPLSGPRATSPLQGEEGAARRYFFPATCAAASRAIGTRKGEHDT
jgi:hypothetical protein